MNKAMGLLEQLAMQAGVILVKYSLGSHDILVGCSDSHRNEPRSFYVSCAAKLDISFSNFRASDKQVKIHSRDGDFMVLVGDKTYNVCSYEKFRDDVNRKYGFVPYSVYVAKIQDMRKSGQLNTLVITRDEVESHR